jgi:4-amino-4-deoxy-L-arabinose transferase-like glycosyltransferase
MTIDLKASKGINWIVVIVGLAFILRAAYGLLQQDALSIYTDTRGDSRWYLSSAYILMTGHQLGTLDVDVSHLSTAPLYLVLIGSMQVLFPWAGAVIVIRLLQAVMGAAACYFAYRIGLALTNDKGVGLLAALVLAISPAFVMESANILTETLYIFLILGALWVYILGVKAMLSTPTEMPSTKYLLFAAVLLGLATLTRAVLLVFPLGLAFHLLLVSGWHKGLQRALLLLVVYSLVVSTWTIYNKLKWDRWVIGAEGFAAFLYIGASNEGWQGPSAVDQNLAQDANLDGQVPTEPEDQQDIYRNTALGIISRNPLEWLTRRVSQLGSAILQPHGTIFFPGESLKDLAARWLQTDRALSGLLAMTAGDAFWPKFIIYIFHYVGLVIGIAGIWITRHSWRITFPLVAFVLYTFGIHFVLEAIPRYIFPTTAVWWIFAAIALVKLAEILRQKGRGANKALVAEGVQHSPLS